MQNQNKQIAKNAVALYFRTIITLLVSLYTSKVILEALGVEDYGIYNVVGGFVSMFALISNSIASAIQRFFTFELGKGDLERQSKVFSLSIWVLIGISLIIIIATETAGFWYVNKKMVIPEERISAALWVFHISVATFIINLISTPYSASIIAHEKMEVYAYQSIFDSILKLIICYFVMISPIDRLVFYSLLLLGVAVVDLLFYLWICGKNFSECRFKLLWDKSLFKEIFSFAGWSFIGNSAAILRTQGANLLLNSFGGPVVNAANGIANTICNAVTQFVNSFTQAFNPQITKRFATQEYNSLMKLLIYGSKYSYYLMFLMSLPIVLNAPFILKVWLGIVPEHTVSFCRLSFLYLLVDSVSRPIITAKNATGDIRNYQIVVGGVLLLMLPLSYLGLEYGLPVEWVAISNVLTAMFAVVVRMVMLRGAFPEWSSILFVKKVLLNVLAVSAAASILPVLIYVILSEGTIKFILTSIISVICTINAVLFIGCDDEERHVLFSKIHEIIIMLKNRL